MVLPVVLVVLVLLVVLPVGLDMRPDPVLLCQMVFEVSPPVMPVDAVNHSL